MKLVELEEECTNMKFFLISGNLIRLDKKHIIVLGGEEGNIVV